MEKFNNKKNVLVGNLNDYMHISGGIYGYSLCTPEHVFDAFNHNYRYTETIKMDLILPLITDKHDGPFDSVKAKCCFLRGLLG